MSQLEVVSSLVCEDICRIADVFSQSVALHSESSTMSYAELERKSSCFAGYLQGRGIVPGSTIAICMDRSFDWIVAALGVLRSGSAYVPLDNGWSVERLAFAIGDSGADLVVGSTELTRSLGLTIAAVDPRQDAGEIKAAQEPRFSSIHPESIAYVIYTSGSTGVPKGVEISHANLAHLIAWHRNAFSLTREDRMSHVAGLGFDAAVWEIWPALATGATLCIPNEAVRSSPEQLRDWLVEEKATLSFVPTALARSMITAPWPASTSLRFLLTGGDVLPQGPIVGLPFEVVNNYGPTECTVVATSGVVAATQERTPSIGRGIDGTSIYLIDQQGQPVADGLPGEIYIGGNGVGRGYRNQPALTSQVFLPDLFAKTPGKRMYKTGDIAVRLSDGTLDFRGRADRQVKIRGQRVELDEISSVLGRHPDIIFATATSLTSADGDTQLVAHILPKNDEAVPTQVELQKFLLKSVPSYMVPSNFVRLNSLPLSSNGKIDFALLERPDETNSLQLRAGRPPETLIEEKILRMVQDLLDSRTVTLEDDFFLVGGHSLIGMQLVLRLREAFGVKVTLRQLFQSPTAERLAATVEAILIETIAGLSEEEAGVQLAEG